MKIKDPFGSKRRQQDRDRLVMILHLLTNQIFQIHERLTPMTPLIQSLVDAVAAERTEVASAVVLINGITDRVTDAVNAALAANPGLAADDLQAITDVVSSIKEETQTLTTAVTTNNPQHSDPAIPAPAPAPAPAPSAPIEDPNNPTNPAP